MVLALLKKISSVMMNETVTFGPYGHPYQEETGSWNAIGPFRKIFVKTRKWGEPIIVQGLRIESVKGKLQNLGINAYSIDDPEDIYELVVPDGQCIKEADMFLPTLQNVTF